MTEASPFRDTYKDDQYEELQRIVVIGSNERMII